ncbi:MAG TPA: Wzt carbohydrate-binding domain-containing protein, partial [Acidimicrobiia bacterium]
GEHGTRWGSGEGHIVAIELLDSAGTPVTRVRTGDSVTFRLQYQMLEPLAKPVFAFDIHTVDGIHVSGTNTRDAGLVADRVEGSGIVDLRIDRLLLVPGTYDASTVLLDWTVTHTYDERHRAFRFDVERGTPEDTAGVTSLGGNWSGLESQGAP